MENQHRKIKGYREMDEGIIRRMNDLKKLECDLMDMLDWNQHHGADPRYSNIARTQLQMGFMAAGRAVARPGGYTGKD